MYNVFVEKDIGIAELEDNVGQKNVFTEQMNYE